MDIKRMYTSDDKEKRPFEDADLCTVLFDAEDILTASGGSGVYLEPDGTVVLPFVPRQ